MKLFRKKEKYLREAKITQVYQKETLDTAMTGDGSFSGIIKVWRTAIKFNDGTTEILKGKRGKIGDTIKIESYRYAN